MSVQHPAHYKDVPAWQLSDSFWLRINPLLPKGWAKSEWIPSSCLCPIQTDRWFPTQLIQPLVEYETPQRQDRIGSLLALTHPRLLAARRHHLLTS